MCTLAACTPRLDTTRRVTGNNSIGAAIYEVVCERLSFVESRHNFRDADGRQAHRVCRDAQPPSAGTPRLQALHQNRQRFIAALDQVLASQSDPTLGHDFKDFIGRLLPLYDNGTMAQQRQAATRFLQDAPQAPGAAAALVELVARPDFTSSPGPASLTEAVFTSSAVDQFLHALVSGLGPGSPGELIWQQFQTVMAQTLRNEPAALPLAEDDFRRLRSFLLQPLVRATPPASPRWVALRDSRGVPVPQLLNGALPYPLVDCHGDGLADIDDEGRFVDCQGLRLPVGAPFGPPNCSAGCAGPGLGYDGMGRLQGHDGALLFVYQDLSVSFLEAVLDQLRVWTAPPAAPFLLGALAPAERFLGPESQRRPTDRRQSEGANNADVAPWVDLATAVGWLVQEGSPAQVLDVLVHLGEQHEATMAQVAQLVLQAVEWRSMPEVQGVALPASFTLPDELLEIAVEMANEPGLFADVFGALQDPNSRALGDLLATHMLYKDRIDFDPINLNHLPLGDFRTPVDFTQPDSPDNASVMQRLLYLVHDAQQPGCNGRATLNSEEYAECGLFRIDSAAEFYLKSILGKADLTLYFYPDDDLLRDIIAGPDGAEPMGLHNVRQVFAGDCIHPDTGDLRACVTLNLTPAAAARMLFVPPRAAELQDPVQSGIFGSFAISYRSLQTDAGPFEQVHAATLFAWELNGFFDASRPLLQAFGKHGREDLVLKMLNALHRHWPTLQSRSHQNHSPSATTFAFGSGLARLQPYLARLQQNRDFDSSRHRPTGRVMEILGELTRSVDSGPKVNGRTGSQVLADFLETLLSTRADAQLSALVADRGRFAKFTGRPTGALAPVHLIYQALDTVAGHPEDGAITGTAARSLSARFLHHALGTPAKASGEQVQRFENRSLLALLQPLQHVSHTLLAQKQGEPNIAQGWRDAAKQWVSDPVVVSTVQLLSTLAQTPESQAGMDAWLQTLVQEHPLTLVDTAVALLHALGDAHTAVPLARALSSAFDPFPSLAGTVLAVLSQAQALDEKRVIGRLLPKLAQRSVDISGTPSAPPTPELCLSVLVDIYLQVNRLSPSTGPWMAEDFTHEKGVIGTLQGFMADDSHGFGRLLELVELRHGHKSGMP